MKNPKRAWLVKGITPDALDRAPKIPVACLLAELLRAVKRPGAVLDPFAGSGSSLVAAIQSGRDAVGVESDQKHLLGAAEFIAEKTGVRSEIFA